MSHQLQAINYSDERLYILPETFAQIYCDTNLSKSALKDKDTIQLKDFIQKEIVDTFYRGRIRGFNKSSLQTMINKIKRMSQKSCIEKYDLYDKNEFCEQMQKLIDFSDLEDWVYLTF